MNEKTKNGVLLGINGLDRTQNVEIAACLSTLGFELLELVRLKSPAIQSAEADGIVTWTFAPVSRDGKYKLKDVLAAWNNEAWLTDPATTDPLAFIICAFRNRQRHLDYIKKGVAMVAFKTGNRWALVPENCSELTKKKLKAHMLNG